MQHQLLCEEDDMRDYGLDDKYPHIYQMLKKNGHSAVKALEILIDACRGDEWALKWIKTMWSLRRGS